MKATSKKKQRTVPFQFFVAPELAAKIRVRSREETLTMSAWVRRMLVFALDKPSERAKQAG